MNKYFIYNLKDFLVVRACFNYKYITCSQTLRIKSLYTSLLYIEIVDNFPFLN